jgi:hypothetical protein
MKSFRHWSSVFVVVCGISNPMMNQNQSQKYSTGLRHVVLFSFKGSSTAQQIQEIEQAFCELPGQIDEVHNFEWGTDVSVENLSQGYTHCFFVTFLSEKDRDSYLVHPAHQEFVSKVEPHLAKAIVIDYWLNNL